ncbi:efflux RND transporter periplasmic adaptor subunit [Pseudobacillus badius]|uniref:efflux RND transporter periplasmic adaptor subunit n=1 Tax=Bacillus badius TaxID=1455 RepID=UPI001CC092A8|nr:efflux RND transporter periplasmic adaptor subunit [Bacillus badius]MED0667911.1 efflux RND transporter periplasmic adaptor subunit [Bacillus badius]UAT31425.1 efflux RND transporter periplasmic adaptor subunit [Bacillus badius]
MSKKKKWIIAISTIIILGLGIGGYIFTKSKFNSEEGAGEIFPTKVSDMMGGMEASAGGLFAGVVEPKETEKIFLSSERGTVKEVFVKEGDVVKANDQLFSYENAEGEMELKQKAIDLDIANSSVKQKKSEIWSLEKQIKNAASEEKSALREQVSQAETDLKLAKFEVEKANLEYQEMKKKVNNNIVRAKVNGLVQKVDEEQKQSTGGENQGEQQPSGPFMQIYNTDAYFVKGNVNELIKDELQVGQEVNVVSRKNPEQKWPGKIIEIGKLPVDEGTDEMGGMGMDEMAMNPQASNYPFQVQLTEHEGLEFGYHVFIELKGEEASQEVMLPTDMIVMDGEKPFVWTVADEKVKKQEVELGKEMPDMMMTVIKSGLTKDDYVIFPDDTVKEGKKVTIDDSLEEHQ